jgi:type II secretory pathway pseudopilin PulG
METLVIVGLLLAAGVGGLVARGIRRRRREAAMRAARDAARAEEQRVEDCGDVVRFFANHLGYVARDLISRDELSVWIDEGISPDDLTDRIWNTCREAEGLCLGEHVLGRTRIPVLLPESLRARHAYVIGKSGSGKTTLLRNLILQDLDAGRGLAVLAPEAEMLRDELLPFIPRERWDDVIYVDPADTERPVPFNPLHLESGEDLDLKADETFTILQRVNADDAAGSAPRMEQILRQGLYLLMRIPGTTLLDFERLLDRQDPSFRNWAVGQVHDPETERFWLRTYAAYAKDAHLPLVSRLGRFLRPRVVRSILCAPGCLNVRAAMDEGKVLLFNLSDGLLGAANAEILGQLVVAKLQTAAMSRADVAKEARRPFSVYLDEFQTFCGVASISYERILSRARKYGLSLILAHQQTGQIPEQLMREILGNVSTVVCFNVSASDAKRIGREMVGEVDGEIVPLDPRELVSLRVGQAWCRIARNVLFLQTLSAPEDGPASVREEVVRRSRLRYGVERQEPIAVPSLEPEESAVPNVAQTMGASLSSEVLRPKRETRGSHGQPMPTAPHPPLELVTPSSGRGGQQHKYLQELLKRWAEGHDWRATIEERILDGLGSVDVSLRKGDLAVACEIAVTTEPDHELGNLQKCIAAGFQRVLVVSSEKKTLNKVRQLAAGALTEEQLAGVAFCAPDDAFAVLESIEADAASVSGTVRGYKVKVKYKAMEEREKTAKRQAVSGVIAKAMKRFRHDA